MVNSRRLLPWAYRFALMRSTFHSLPASMAIADRPEPVVLVLDQFEAQAGQQISRDLDFVLRLAEAGLRLVVVSRADPGAPLHRQFLRTWVFIMGAVRIISDMLLDHQTSQQRRNAALVSSDLRPLPH